MRGSCSIYNDPSFRDAISAFLDFRTGRSVPVPKLEDFQLLYWNALHARPVLMTYSFTLVVPAPAAIASPVL